MSRYIANKQFCVLCWTINLLLLSIATNSVFAQSSSFEATDALFDSELQSSLGSGDFKFVSYLQEQETEFGDGQPQRQDLSEPTNDWPEFHSAPTPAWRAETTDLQQQINELKDELEKEREAARKLAESGINVGGAVRFQYSLNDYQNGNNNRLGDIDFDVFRLDLNGQIKGVELSAQYRWYQFMDVLHHGYVGYGLNEAWKVQAGITRVPFGNLTYNSHSFFFSSAYYVGLEDDYDAGIKLINENEHHDLRLAYFLTDELGGIDGYVRNRTFRYSYDAVGVRGIGEGTFDPPARQIAEHNGVSLRYVRKFAFAEVGGSVVYNGLKGRSGSAGDRSAYALHMNRSVDRWNLQLQYTTYDFALDDGSDLVAVGAFAFFDTIPASANIYTANVAYKLPVEIGPVTSLNFYNDFNVVADKSGLNDDSVMNVTGIAVSAGPIFSNIDLVVAKNHPFIGGSLGSDGGDYNTRLNINVGYYF